MNDRLRTVARLEERIKAAEKRIDYFHGEVERK